MPLGPQHSEYRFPRLGTGFRGLWLVEGLTAEEYQTGYLRTVRNYHLIGRGRLRKRQGTAVLIDTAINGAAAIQGMAFYNLGSLDKIVAVSNGKIKHYNGSTITDITGTLTPTTGNTNLCRFAQFQQGSSSYLVGTGPGSSALWAYDGTGNAVSLASLVTDDNSRPPSRAVDIAEWGGRLWAINTDLSSVVVEYSDDGVINSWGSGNYIYCTRSSKGVALARHNNGVLLVFHEDSIYRIEWNPGDSAVGGVELISTALVDGSIGCMATNSVINSQGVTYFASERGIYRIRSAGKPAEYISYPIQDYWKTLQQGQLPYMSALELGGANNEVGFVVSSTGQVDHDSVMIWNPQLEAWSIFDSPTGYLKHSCGCRYTNSDGQKVTVLGGYDGKLYKAWGDKNYDVGYLDGGSTGAAVESEWSTGMLDFGYGGLKRIKRTWLELQLEATVSFTVKIQMVGGVVSDITPESLSAGTEGDMLSIDFIFDTSVLAADDTPAQIQMRKTVKARMFRFTFVENAQTPPHTFNSLKFQFDAQGRKFSARQ